MCSTYLFPFIPLKLYGSFVVASFITLTHYTYILEMVQESTLLVKEGKYWIVLQ